MTYLRKIFRACVTAGASLTLLTLSQEQNVERERNVASFDESRAPISPLLYSKKKMILQEYLLAQTDSTLNLDPVIHRLIFSDSPLLSTDSFWMYTLMNFSGPMFQVGLLNTPLKVGLQKSFESSDSSLSLELNVDKFNFLTRSVFFLEFTKKSGSPAERYDRYKVSQSSLSESHSESTSFKNNAFDSEFKRASSTLTLGVEAIFD